MKTSEVRQSFLNFFKDKGHTPVASSSLVPANDPTLMFTNAGMNQFKDCFLGADVRAYKRATTCQKVMRISGKHNDFENVGVTARHHTFFEMLGNFSFGDYFKRDAIAYAWEYVTGVLKISPARLWITVHEKDDEAEELWATVAGVARDRIVRLGDEDNFWAMGETGPCGPCTELHVYMGDEKQLQTREGFLRGDGSYLEIWNLVFMQYNRSAGGVLNPLPKPSVDTGMGLERVASIMQGHSSNYDCDALRGIISTAEEISGYKYDGRSYEVRDMVEDRQYARDVAMRVLADHSRAMTFIVADGVLPSSDGRGYILRRIIRRAIRHGRVLDHKEPFLATLCNKVVDIMGDAYPELIEQRDTVRRVVEAEERKFHETLELGLVILNKEVEKIGSGKLFSGKTAFLLHDTYGFPLDLTEDALKPYKLKVDGGEFHAAMEAQRQRAREDRKSRGISYQAVSLSGPKTNFVGYSQNVAESKLQQIIRTPGEESVGLVFETTPFYAESGGQVGDTGAIRIKDVELEVLDTQKVQNNYYVHQCRITAGSLTDALVGENSYLEIDSLRRDRIRAHHSATHLVHAALRKVLGTHVKQAGSRVDESSLRFDYNHFEAVTTAQLAEIEAYVNALVLANNEISTKELPIDEAKKLGAMALFGEKYGSVVRVVQIGSESIELCGGTHARRSGDLGTLFISSEGGIAAGVRRIECIAGKAAFEEISRERTERSKIIDLIKGDGSDLVERVSKLQQRNRELERELDSIKGKLATAASSDWSSSAKTSPNGVKVIAQRIEISDPNTVRNLIDNLRRSLGTGVVALASIEGDSASLFVGVTDDLSKNINAGKLVKEAAACAGGKGGGRADFAQAGGVDSSRVDVALQKIFELVA